MATEVKFSEWMQKGFDIYKTNLGVFIPASLVAVLLSAVTCGVPAGPLFAGLFLIALDLLDGKAKPEMGRLFNGFNCFAQSFLFAFVWGLIAFVGMVVLSFIGCVGRPLAVAGSLVLGTLLMFGLCLIADRRMAFWPASMQSMAAVTQQFWPLLGYYVVASVLGGVGSVLCGFGVFLTLPLTVCMVCVAYREIFPVQAAAEAAAPGAAATKA